jgi:hypothetical protein
MIRLDDVDHVRLVIFLLASISSSEYCWLPPDVGVIPIHVYQFCHLFLHSIRGNNTNILLQYAANSSPVTVPHLCRGWMRWRSPAVKRQQPLSPSIEAEDFRDKILIEMREI